jgi:riboflavin biosynthesis pyrimidine reductase
VVTFEEYCRRREQQAANTAIPGFRTVVDETANRRFVPLGNRWTCGLFDGAFYRSEPIDPLLPAVSLVFVQSRDGNTSADNPSHLGGGEGDKHLIYEGLSRVDADAVLAGSTTARSDRMVFSVWHPELVRLRLERGKPRHPAQVIVTDRADLAIERALIFQVPDLPVFIATRTSAVGPLRQRVASRPWIEVVDSGNPLSLTGALRHLKSHGLNVISAIGGRRTATALLNEHLVDDIYLTTSPIDAGEPNTPYYEGPPLPLARVLLKQGLGPEAGVRFEHFVVERSHEGTKSSHEGH